VSAGAAFTLGRLADALGAARLGDAAREVREPEERRG